MSVGEQESDPKRLRRHEGEATLLRLFLGESDQVRGRPLFELLVQKARHLGLAGATVLRGVEGFGGSGKVHSARLLRLAEELPLVLEIVDDEKNLAPFVVEAEHLLEASRSGGLLTFEKVRTIRWERRRRN